MLPVSAKSRLSASFERMSGLLRLRERSVRGAAILAYHGVAADGYTDPMSVYTISRTEFSRHIRWLSQHRVVVSLAEMIDAIKVGNDPDCRWVAITMDDALRNQVVDAADVLNESGLPWTLAVPAGLVSRRRTIWSYELRVLIHLCWTLRSIPHPQDVGTRLSTTSNAERIHAEQTIYKSLFSKCSSSERDSYLQGLIAEVGTSAYEGALEEDARFVMATWDDLRSIATPKITFCAHGWMHSPQTSTISLAELQAEFSRPKEALTHNLGIDIKGFSLPHGVIHQRAAQTASEHDYEWGLTSQNGHVDGKSNVLLMPRFAAEYPLTILRRSLSKRWT